MQLFASMDAASERREIELRRARSARMWKMIVSASAAGALTVALVTSLRDDHASRARDGHGDAAETQEPSRVETTGAETPRPAETRSARAATVGIPNAPVSPDDTAGTTPGASGDGTAGAISTTTTSSATVDAAPLATAPLATAPPATAPIATAAAPTATAPPADTSSDGSTTSDAGAAPAPGSDQGQYAREASAPDGGGARDAQAPDPWAPPSMSAGAGPFSTQAPYWGASSWVSNPNAGAGRFPTEAPPWSASAFTSDPNAGAGPFTTEWNIPGYGAWPYWAFGPVAPR